MGGVPSVKVENGSIYVVGAGLQPAAALSQVRKAALLASRAGRAGGTAEAGVFARLLARGDYLQSPPQSCGQGPCYVGASLHEAEQARGTSPRPVFVPKHRVCCPWPFHVRRPHHVPLLAQGLDQRWQALYDSRFGCSTLSNEASKLAGSWQRHAWHMAWEHPAQSVAFCD